MRGGPPRQRLSTKPALDEGENEDITDGDGSDVGNVGGGGSGDGEGEGNGGGSGEGEGQGGTGPRGGNRGRRPFSLGDVRILLDPADRCRGKIRFTALESGTVLLGVEEVGDSSSIPRDDIVISHVNDGGKEEIEQLPVAKGVRYELLIEGDGDLDAAWQIKATTVEVEE